MTTVPRIAVTAFGVLISITSPGFINPLATATAMRPAPRLIVATPGTSVIVRTDRSRAVTVALPPSSTRTSERSPVVIRSRRKRSSLNLSSWGSGSATRSEEHTSELQSQSNIVCRLLLETNTERSLFEPYILKPYHFNHAFIPHKPTAMSVTRLEQSFQRFREQHSFIQIHFNLVLSILFL